MNQTAQRLLSELTGALVGLARKCDHNGRTKLADHLIAEGLFAANANYDDQKLQDLIVRVRAEESVVAPGCDICANPCGDTAEYDMNQLEQAVGPIGDLKRQILERTRELATAIYPKLRSGIEAEDCLEFFYKALFWISYDTGAEYYPPILEEAEILIKNVAGTTE